MIVVRSSIHHSPLIEKFQGCADFPTFVGGGAFSAGYSSSLRDHRSPSSPSLRVSAALFFFFFFFPFPPPLYSSFRHFPPRSLFPSSEPLKWQSFLRRRPVEAKRGERSTSSSLDALRFSYAATSRVSGSTERTRRMNITGWTVCSGS